MSDPGRLAWTVLIGAFILFCVITGAILGGLRWFLFDSTVPLTAVLSVSRNTVGVQEDTSTTGFQAVRSDQYLFHDSYLTTDSSSQGFITFTDPVSQEVVASVTLRRDSTMKYGSATQPRFDFSVRPYFITILALDGEIEVDAVPNLGRSITIEILSEHGEILITEPGQYAIISRADEFSVLTRSGIAVVINHAQETRSIPADMQGSIDPLTNELISEQILVDILPDGSFNEVNPANEELSTAWRCYVSQDNPDAAVGDYKKEFIYGRSAMHIVRIEDADASARNHAEVGCLQYLNTIHEPLPVTAYDYLELRASMQIRDRPYMLSACGQAGSECPVMIEIIYENQYEQQERWIHGFYTRYDSSLGWPLRCDSCAQDHEQLNQNTWYTYASGNLLQLLPPDQRPVAINSVRFYASGHEYEVLLSEVALMAGTMLDEEAGDADEPVGTETESEATPAEPVVLPTEAASPPPAS